MLTGVSVYEVAHIYPQSMIEQRPAIVDNSIPESWKLLSFFFDKKHLTKWRTEIFRDPGQPSKTSDGCFNMMCLGYSASALWQRGLFALRPVRVSDGGTEMTV